jgi:hypothetical protein
MVRDDVGSPTQQETDPAIPTVGRLICWAERTKYKLVILPVGIPSGGLCVFVSGLLAAVASRPPF